MVSGVQRDLLVWHTKWQRPGHELRSISSSHGNARSSLSYSINCRAMTPAHRWAKSCRKSHERRAITKMRPTGPKCGAVAMTRAAQPPFAGTTTEFGDHSAPPVKRPARWSVSNWPVGWKVFAIVLVPLLLAGAFGGLRIYSGWNAAADLQWPPTARRWCPPSKRYTAALESALLARIRPAVTAHRRLPTTTQPSRNCSADSVPPTSCPTWPAA